MLTTQRASVMNLENAIRGARNPMNSWDRMDSAYNEAGAYILGPNDLGLAVRLARAGSDHRKFLRQIFVSVDITAPLYWWKEFDTYKVGTVANSTSTMHKLATTPITLDCFEILIPIKSERSQTPPPPCTRSIQSPSRGKTFPATGWMKADLRCWMPSLHIWSRND